MAVIDIPALPAAGGLANSDFMVLTQGTALARRTTLGAIATHNLSQYVDLQAIADLNTTPFGRSVLETANAAALRALAGSEQLGMLAGVNTQTASYTLALIDIGKVVEMNVAGANTLTVPPNSAIAFAVGSRVDLAQVGAGQTTVTPGAGVTIRQRESKLKLAGQWAMASLYKRATDEWVLVGDLSA